MSIRVACGVLAGAALVALAGCGSSGDGSAGSLMDRCRGGQQVTVDDPAGDGTLDPEHVGRRLRGPVNFADVAAAVDPEPFDLRPVTIATTDRLLCASVTFAAGDPPGDTGGVSHRTIVLELAPARPPQEDELLARLVYGDHPRGATWLDHSAFDTNEGEGYRDPRLTGVYGREVQMVVPVRGMIDLDGTYEGSTPATRLDPQSFSWRISVTSDCVPGPDRLIVFPSGRPVPVRVDSPLEVSGCG